MARATVGEVLAGGSRDLLPVSDTPARDAQVLLAEVLGRPREWLLAHPEAAVPDAIHTQWIQGLRRLKAGEPLAYVLGWAEFYGRRFAVSPDVLIPRPETETLVEAALEVIDRSRPQRVLDLGTGSGGVAITLALERPTERVIAVDVSRAALRVAIANASQLGATGRMAFVMADLTLGLTLHDTVVTANLPYVASRDVAALRGEPRLALDGGPDGLDVIRRFLMALGRCRPRRSTVLLEIGAGEGASVLDIAESVCEPDSMALRQDLAGRDRIILLVFDGAQP